MGKGIFLMRFLQYLNEEYVAITSGGTTIFKNPTAKEIKEAGKSDGYVRCVVDFKKKNLYVFSSYLLHDQAMPILTKEEGMYSWVYSDWHDPEAPANNYYSFCTAKITNTGKLEFYRSDTGVGWNREGKMLDFKWIEMSDSWLNRWFGPGYIKKYTHLSNNPKDWR